MKATDLIVIAGAVIGVAIALTGVAHLDPRVRERFGRRNATAARTTALAAALVIAGALVVMVSIGGFE